ncbi:hypothetical protein [uncultured Fluviicola sp.]|uniref:hypothetical protein n=1 Tax=uncultured Fluviicola sp. TaxID=463303 RepID=UPI0025CBD821|nr:hypothetical protein [uncultured Fluviicola sp.]
MPYSGGSSTTTGVEYQNWFLTLLFSYAFFEQDYHIYPEALRTSMIKVDDIVVKSKHGDFFYSLKFRSPSKNLHWSHSDLCSQDILLDFKQQLIATPKAKLVLISESNCYLFSEVFNRAINASGSQDIHEKLDNEFAVDVWEKAKHVLDFDDFQMIDFARRVTNRTLPIEDLKYLVRHRFMHVTNHDLVAELLLSKALECSSNKRVVNKLVINNWLQERTIPINFSNK